MITSNILKKGVIKTPGRVDVLNIPQFMDYNIELQNIEATLEQASVMINTLDIYVNTINKFKDASSLQEYNKAFCRITNLNYVPTVALESITRVNTAVAYIITMEESKSLIGRMYESIKNFIMNIFRWIKGLFVSTKKDVENNEDKLDKIDGQTSSTKARTGIDEMPADINEKYSKMFASLIYTTPNLTALELETLIIKYGNHIGSGSISDVIFSSATTVIDNIVKEQTIKGSWFSKDTKQLKFLNKYDTVQEYIVENINNNAAIKQAKANMPVIIDKSKLEDAEDVDSLNIVPLGYKNSTIFALSLGTNGQSDDLNDYKPGIKKFTVKQNVIDAIKIPLFTEINIAHTSSRLRQLNSKILSKQTELLEVTARIEGYMTKLNMDMSEEISDSPRYTLAVSTLSYSLTLLGTLANSARVVVDTVINNSISHFISYLEDCISVYNKQAEEEKQNTDKEAADKKDVTTESVRDAALDYYTMSTDIAQGYYVGNRKKEETESVISKNKNIILKVNKNKIPTLHFNKSDINEISKYTHGLNVNINNGIINSMIEYFELLDKVIANSLIIMSDVNKGISIFRNIILDTIKKGELLDAVTNNDTYSTLFPMTLVQPFIKSVDNYNKSIIPLQHGDSFAKTSSTVVRVLNYYAFGGIMRNLLEYKKVLPIPELYTVKDTVFEESTVLEDRYVSKITTALPTNTIISIVAKLNRGLEVVLNNSFDNEKLMESVLKDITDAVIKNNKDISSSKIKSTLAHLTRTGGELTGIKYYNYNTLIYRNNIENAIQKIFEVIENKID